jgi:hypothetical protein
VVSSAIAIAVRAEGKSENDARQLGSHFPPTSLPAQPGVCALGRKSAEPGQDPVNTYRQGSVNTIVYSCQLYLTRERSQVLTLLLDGSPGQARRGHERRGVGHDERQEPWSCRDAPWGVRFLGCMGCVRGRELPSESTARRQDDHLNGHQFAHRQCWSPKNAPKRPPGTASARICVQLLEHGGKPAFNVSAPRALMHVLMPMTSTMRPAAPTGLCDKKESPYRSPRERRMPGPVPCLTHPA